MPKITKHKRLAKQIADFRVNSRITDDVVIDFLSSINHPRALTVWLLYSYGEHDQLTELECDPMNYQDAFEFRDAYTASKFLSKASFLKTTFDKKKVALEKFQKYEDLCRSTNNRFRRPASDPLFLGPNVWLLNATKRKIQSVLGDFGCDEFFDNANWGPGVTTKLKGSYVSAINKFHLENGITRDLYSLVGGVFDAAYPRWAEHLTFLYGNEHTFDLQVGNKIITVAKDSKADRVIAVEPGLNLWFQKSIGTMIRRRLRRCSIDLNTQERNQELARLGSKYHDHATIDFSSASDSISLEVVRELLPPRWFIVMDSCRSKYGINATGPIWWEKFSSMGNGFTFELESLIFYAAASAVVEYLQQSGTISVYGDDVILPTTCVDLFISFSAFLGFRVNQSKSFYSGDFRESCGAHWWNGIDCKPVFLKERVRNVQSVYKLANGIRLLSHRRNGYGCDIKFRGCYINLVAGIPKELLFRVSATLGDTGLISNFDEARPPRAKDGIEGYHLLTLNSVGLTDRLDGTAVLLARLWQLSVQEYNETYTLRGRTKYKVSNVLVHQWYNLGPWI